MSELYKKNDNTNEIDILSNPYYNLTGFLSKYFSNYKCYHILDYKHLYSVGHSVRTRLNKTVMISKANLIIPT